MNTSRLGILYGGKSSEHEVSLRSAASVIRQAPWNDEAISLIGIDHQGRWFLQDPKLVEQVRSGADLSIATHRPIAVLPSGGLAAVASNTLEPLDLDVIFPVLHGTFGEDGTIQGLLEVAGLPYVGAGILGSALGMDKEAVKRIWQQNGLPVVPFRAFRQSTLAELDLNALYADLRAEFGPVLFVKPARCGSSVGITRIDGPAAFEAAVATALQFDSKILIEPAIDAREIEVSVIGNDRPQSFQAGEVASSHEFYDYEAKYLDPDGAQIIIPAKIDATQMAAIRRIAEAAYSACEARGLSRVDLFLDRQTGTVYLNEINTLPGFTNISMFSMMCAQDGLSYPDLIVKLCDLAIEEFQAKENLHFSRLPTVAV